MNSFHYIGIFRNMYVFIVLMIFCSPEDQHGYADVGMIDLFTFTVGSRLNDSVYILLRIQLNLKRIQKIIDRFFLNHRSRSRILQ